MVWRWHQILEMTPSSDAKPCRIVARSSYAGSGICRSCRAARGLRPSRPFICHGFGTFRTGLARNWAALDIKRQVRSRDRADGDQPGLVHSLSHGILNEIYYRRSDQASTRDCQTASKGIVVPDPGCQTGGSHHHPHVSPGRRGCVESFEPSRGRLRLIRAGRSGEPT
jgi:hypothetical protein